MAGIEFRGPPHHVRVIGVRDDVTLVRAAVHGLGECIGDAEEETS